jgi:DNA-directed RNA polymerase specialized sigma24 family protein
MLDNFQPAPEASITHISIFAERYNKLLAIARSLTRNDLGQAVDIVHDTLIEFVRYSPDLHKIDNLDGYLRAMLCNLFKTQKRRVAVRSECELSIENYDMIEGVLPGIVDRCYNPNLLLQKQDVLRVICEYACFRKERLKLGSVLILRFFHGYHTSEIALIMGVTASAVSHQLKLAQAEVCLYLKDPKHSNFFREIIAVRGRYKLNYGSLADDLVGELRRVIFHSSSFRECILRSNLYKLYEGQCRKEIDCKTLAHIISCAGCLEAASAFLGLDLLSERYPADMLSRRVKGENTSRQEIARWETVGSIAAAQA